MKKTSSKSRPLSLKRETVKVLASSQLASAQGGGFTDLIRVDPTERGSICDGCLLDPNLPPIGTRSAIPGACGSESIIRTSGLLIP
jgi:hypothetical protein